MNNPLIQEVRDSCEALAAKFDFDLHRIFEDAMKRQAAESAAGRRKTPKKPKAARASRSLSTKK
ncbi:MAG TPA: hypothetical protein PK648_13055 [Verrucomicrobiales bacterium]|nr:hypothetical protein [Verrucomicrobiales bacterium]